MSKCEECDGKDDSTTSKGAKIDRSMFGERCEQ